MIHDPVRPADNNQLPLFDEEALDIADYLRAEAEAAERAEGPLVERLASAEQQRAARSEP
jgi:hypothetical protein